MSQNLKKKNYKMCKFKKVKCLGITNKGFRCSRSVLIGKNYCFQHQVKKKVVKKVSKEIITKKELGQFYSVNCDYILTDMKILKGVQSIIEPFGGCGSLVK